MSASHKNTGSPTGKAKNQAETSKSAKKPTPTKPDEMNEDVLEFITAIDDYKRIHQRQFPNWSEVLEILKELGYSKVS